jgi:hypothetical protein
MIDRIESRFHFRPVCEAVFLDRTAPSREWYRRFRVLSDEVSQRSVADDPHDTDPEGANREQIGDRPLLIHRLIPNESVKN